MSRLPPKDMLWFCQGWDCIPETLASATAASWAQAVGSILAVLAAGLLAGAQSRREEHRRLRDRAAQFALPVKLSEEAARILLEAANMVGREPGPFLDNEHVERIVVALREFNILNVPDADTVLSIRELETQLGYVKGFFAGVHASHLGGLSDPDLQSRQAFARYEMISGIVQRIRAQAARAI